jgi:hypothetical protein
MTRDTDVAIVELATSQHGVFSVAQARSIEVGRHSLQRAVASDLLARPFLGVYRLKAMPKTFESRLLAACLAGGSRAAASHRSAAALWDVAGGCRDFEEIVAPRWRRPHVDGLIVHEMKVGNPRHLTVIDGIPVTGPELTALHIGAIFGPDVAEKVLESFLNRGLTTRDTCNKVLRRYARQGRNGVVAFREALKRRDPNSRPTQSEMETRMLQLCRRFGIPDPVTQFEIRADDGLLLATVDLAWPTAKFAVEYQSLRHHTDEDRRANDRRRIRSARRYAWDVLEVGPDDALRYAADTAAAIKAAIRRGEAAFLRL